MGPMNRFLISGLGIAFFVFTAWSSWEQHLLQKTAITQQATVSKTWITRRRGGAAYNMAYAFDVLGKRFEGEGLVSQKTYVTRMPGQTIEIRYVPSQPSISETAEMSHNGTSLFVMAGLGIPVSLGMIILPFLKKPESVGTKRSETVTEDILADPAPAESGLKLPPMVRGIAFMVYPVSDMQRARAFYEGGLGLKKVRNFGEEWIEYHLWDTCFALTTMMGPEVKPCDDGGKIALEVSDVDGFVNDLRKRGTRIKKEPFSTPVCRMAVIYDPEGNALTLHKRTALS